MKPIVIAAKFPGKCVKCGGGIAAGEKVEFEKGKGVWHPKACPAVPAPPPEWVAEPIAPKLAEMEAKLAAAVAAKEAAYAAKVAAEKEYVEAAGAAGLCFHCKGSHSVEVRWSLDPGCYEWVACSCVKEGKPSLPLAEVEAAIAPLPAKKLEAGFAFASAENMVKAVEEAIESLVAVERGAWVKVVKGRKVPKGVEGECFWVGESKWGPKIGMKNAAGEVFWLAPGNVEVLSKKVLKVHKLAA